MQGFAFCAICGDRAELDDTLACIDCQPCLDCGGYGCPVDSCWSSGGRGLDIYSQRIFRRHSDAIAGAIASERWVEEERMDGGWCEEHRCPLSDCEDAN
jgi:hypothetical protein